MIGYYAVSLQGKSHITNNIPCQDSHKCRILENGWTVSVIADGLGSYSKAKEAAEIAVNSVIDFVDSWCPRFWFADTVLACLMNAFTYFRR
jgi:hypothetical protein